MAQTGIDLNLFNLLAERPDQTWSLQQLEKATGAESALLRMSMSLGDGMLYRLKLTFARPRPQMFGVVWHDNAERGQHVQSVEHFTQSGCPWNSCWNQALVSHQSHLEHVCALI